ncbi:MAG: tripartite tricarboxylate transporter substrate binding protein [Kiloniellaceae bacterium]
MLKKTLFFAAMSVAVLAAGPSVAADYPERDVTYIVPFNAGGESDVTARMQEEPFKAVTGKGFVMQYKPGAGGAAAWSQLNGLQDDGYTIMGINLPHLFLQPMSGKVGYKTDDITVVNVFQLTPHALLVNADSPIKTLDDYIAQAKQTPGAITVAGTGSNSANQVAQLTFDQGAEITTTYIPFTGTAATTAALLGNQVSAQWGFTTVAVAQGDKVRMLGVALEERHPLFPDVPTFKEKGINLVGGAHRGVAVPKGTPEETREAISSVFSKVNQNPDFQEKMAEAGFILINVDYAGMDEFMSGLGKEYTEVGKALGLVN